MRQINVLKQWETKAGFTAVVIKTDLGHNCGYVGIDSLHPLYGKDYNEHCNCLSPMLEKVMSGDLGKRGVMTLLFANSDEATIDTIFDVHGSVTYSNNNKEYPIESELHWLGFDCAHAGDEDRNCDLDYCITECESLAEQINGVIV